MNLELPVVWQTLAFLTLSPVTTVLVVNETLSGLNVQGFTVPGDHSPNISEKLMEKLGKKKKLKARGRLYRKADGLSCLHLPFIHSLNKRGLGT